MALVYEARRESLEGVSPRVAVKIILPEHRSSDTFRELFINEARLGASMHHQNLVQIQDFDCEGDTYFLVMEYVEGLTLRKAIALCERAAFTIPMGVIAEIGRQACDGLHFAHTATDEGGRPLKLVHRDIKPSNLILSPHGVVKVLDFGISKGVLREERRGSVKGTWGYMAPEQAVGADIGPVADVFGLATVLFELAALRPMFLDHKKEEIRRLLKDDHAARMAATLDGAVYGPLIGVLVRALQRDPSARFGSAEGFGRALSALLPDPITARDEVVRFFQAVEELEKGLPISTISDARAPHPPRISQEGSLVVQPRARRTMGGIVTFLAGIALSLAVLTAITLVSVAFLGKVVSAAMTDVDPDPQIDIVAGTPPAPEGAALDEPPGPAGIDAPGEERPPPTGRRKPTPSSVVQPVEAPPVQPESEPGHGEIVPPEVIVEAPPPVVEGSIGQVVIDAKQPAEVYIGGQFIDTAPVRKGLPAGSYDVSLVAADGRRRTFQIEVTPDKRVKKVWDFDRMEWR
ncbi:MAG TPA: hypothetical protein ENK18_00930 [Deltaproteobacteria bacterium]|nr:hypothetical protein [Deltaproteobacteria bacterium]